MDNGRLDLGAGETKYQGVALRDIVAKWEPAADAAALRFVSRSGDSVLLPLTDVRTDGDLRLWNVDAPDGIRFAVAVAGGEVHALDVVAIVVE